MKQILTYLLFFLTFFGWAEVNRINADQPALPSGVTKAICKWQPEPCQYGLSDDNIITFGSSPAHQNSQCSQSNGVASGTPECYTSDDICSLAGGYATPFTSNIPTGLMSTTVSAEYMIEIPGNHYLRLFFTDTEGNALTSSSTGSISALINVCDTAADNCTPIEATVSASFSGATQPGSGLPLGIYIFRGCENSNMDQNTGYAWVSLYNTDDTDTGMWAEGSQVYAETNLIYQSEFSAEYQSLLSECAVAPPTASPTTAAPTTATPTTATPTTATPTTAAPTTAAPTTASPTTASPTTASPTPTTAQSACKAGEEPDGANSCKACPARTYNPIAGQTCTESCPTKSCATGQTACSSGTCPLCEKTYCDSGCNGNYSWSCTNGDCTCSCVNFNGDITASCTCCQSGSCPSCSSGGDGDASDNGSSADGGGANSTTISVVVIVILVVAIAGGYFFYNTQQKTLAAKAAESSVATPEATTNPIGASA